MFRIDRATRDLSELLNPAHWVSRVWGWGSDPTRVCRGCPDCQPDVTCRDEPYWRCHGRRRVSDARYGVSVMGSVEELADYFAQNGGHLDNTVLVELAGPLSDDEPHDEWFGEHLILPTRIVSVEPVGEEFIAAMRAAQDLYAV